MTDYDEIKNNLSFEDIIKIINHFYPNINYDIRNETLILPTICHNIDENEASKKLYYYNNTKLFFCYTHCNESFDIYELIKKMLKMRGQSDDFHTVFSIISKSCDISYSFKENEKYKSLKDRYKKLEVIPSYKIYDEKVLNLFSDMFPKVWVEEGIKRKTMKEFGIKVSVPKEQIIIPHRDINNNLIGVRVRNLNPEIVARGDKYMPAKINGVYYSHPLMYNLYGLNVNKNNIKKYKTAWIFEGEKSVLLCNGWFKDSLAVASCGDKFNKFQLKLLLNLGVKDVIICYDRMNFDKKTDNEYFSKLMKLGEKYKNYANISFIFDRNYILDYKAAPVDSGVEIFKKLMRERVQI